MGGLASARACSSAAIWPARYEVVVRAFVDERQIVYMGFVIATRIVVGLLLLPVYKWIDGKSTRTAGSEQEHVPRLSRRGALRCHS